MAFITKEDMYSHIYEENIDLIQRDDPNNKNIKTAIAAGISEAQSYMSKYDIEELFAATEDERDPILLLYTKNLIAWHFIGLCNAGVGYEVTEDRYNKASSWFLKVQSNKATPYGWPLKPKDPASGSDPASTVKYGGNKKRSNHY